MSKIKVFCFGFGQVARYFIKKIINENQDIELNVSSRKKTDNLKFEGLDFNTYEFNLDVDVFAESLGFWKSDKNP